MAIEVMIKVTSPANGNSLNYMNQVDLLSALHKLEAVLVEVSKVKMHQRPDLDFNWTIETVNPPKGIDQVIHIVPGNSEFSTLTGTTTGVWRACEAISITELMKQLIKYQILLGFTDFTYTRQTVV